MSDEVNRFTDPSVYGKYAHLGTRTYSLATFLCPSSRVGASNLRTLRGLVPSVLTDGQASPSKLENY